MPEEQTPSSMRAQRDEILEVMGREGYDLLSEQLSEQADMLHETLEKRPLPDLQIIAVECHNVAGVALMLGFSRYGELLSDIERAAKTGNPETVRRLILQVRKTWESDKALLQIH